MVVLNADHPDIEDFVNWKVREERKVADLVVADHARYIQLPRCEVNTSIDHAADFSARRCADQAAEDVAFNV